LGRIYLGEQLPITQHLQTFKEKLNNNDVVMVKVGTGSGKSTVIPPYLIGLGYEKVVVTQPRRLPCR
jgi:HrpA-like RNA helicase